MTMSVPLKAAYRRAALFEKQTTAYCYYNGHRVSLVHEDGTKYDFNHAFYMREGSWIYIFTEHHGHFAFSLDEIVVLASSENNGEWWRTYKCVFKEPLPEGW